MTWPRGPRSGGLAVVEAETSDAATIARLHALAFSRAWSEDEFETLLAQRNVLGLMAIERGWWGPRPAGFILLRMAADEAEILSIAVHPTSRRAGLGRALIETALDRLPHYGVRSVFLEVDEANAGALALYRRFGFDEVGRRTGYYGHGRADALILRREAR